MTFSLIATSVYSSPVKKRLKSFAYLLPLLELLFGAATMLVPALPFFFRLKHAAHGTGSVLMSSGDMAMRIPSDRFLSVALDSAGRWAAKPATILNVPAKFVEIVVSLLVAHKANWHPASLLPSTWHALVYPIYALPAWAYIGLGIDAGIGRCLVRRWNVVLSLFLALTFAVLFCVFRFGMSASEREGQELLSWFIEGFALWAVLFAIPFVAWLLQRKRGTPLVRDESLPS
jgi:hypothetical protein